MKPQTEGGGGRQGARLSGRREDDVIDRTGTEPAERKWQFAPRSERDDRSSQRSDMTSSDVLHVNYSCSACRVSRGLHAPRLHAARCLGDVSRRGLNVNVRPDESCAHFSWTISRITQTLGPRATTELPLVCLCHLSCLKQRCRGNGGAASGLQAIFHCLSSASPPNPLLPS